MRRGQRTAHRWMSYAMAAAVFVILGLAFVFSQGRGDLPPPEQLAPAATTAGGGS